MTDSAPRPPAAHWWNAWFAVWSPLAAWVTVVALLAAAGRLEPGGDVLFWGALGFGAACVLLGLFVVIGLATDALESTADDAAGTARERARLALLSLAGVVASLIGYGGLVVLIGFVLLMSAFRGIQH
ncbi:hypothetical protein GobsT_27500 [Gemmata obscuriglobus]|uniref:Uncharacterized protein n=1 Tax=Gemmata obscuriglobus TaxID=114 RepID=A0A2Z3HBH7_9BACT|nr:hypothetical protein [Gemmata obscuriglobus]AWM38994.1 hypothetical protein C1280_19735 [Gemmata obscuriglobus]QEG27982.1 hypothetical protein GobsT_27500 [Gemmata obscuriglobus]VTS05490.1 unnamed protein product [Gemmata obscuriglobus UQM 2246]